MGVLGLWDVLESVGHPIKIEGLEGKVLGVDANIWLYKFIRGFRDKDNATNIESHKLGLFNRISKLLFYRIKPVFVFDGPAPVLKRRTLERRQNVRNKHLTKVQDTAMKILASQLKSQYPDADVDKLKITLPDLRSNNLVAAEKLTDEDRELFYLPVIKNGDNLEDGYSSESDGELLPMTKAHYDSKYDTAKIDIHSEDFEQLPAELRYEILHDIKTARKRIGNPEILPDDANSFSNFQLERLKARRKVQEEIEKCEKEICTNYTGEMADGSSIQAFRVQSDSTATILYRNNTYDPKALDKLKEEEEMKHETKEEKEQNLDASVLIVGEKTAIEVSIRPKVVAPEERPVIRLPELRSKMLAAAERFTDKEQNSSMQFRSYQISDDSDDDIQVQLYPTKTINDKPCESDAPEEKAEEDELDSSCLIVEEIAATKPMANTKVCETITSSPELESTIPKETETIIDKTPDRDLLHLHETDEPKIDSDNLSKNIDKNEPAQNQSTYIASQSQSSTSHADNIINNAQRTNRVTNKIVEDAKELLRLFGIPYIDAAGEAEAQCAKLEELKLTEGTITDDSDIWLFGSQNVFRYFFNDDKYVMQYKMTDIEYHVRMTRENLVCFAMLVGSDYTDGIMNVGPVNALEILSEFPGDEMEPLVKFRDWRQTALFDKKAISDKKRKKLLKYRLPEEFPSRAVYEGYMRPVADSSSEKFSWGVPELDELREYARRNFGWDPKKVDEKLVPVMKRLNEKKLQRTIDTFFFKTQANRNPEMFRSKRVNQALNKIAKRAAREPAVAAGPKAGVSEVVNLSEDED